MRHFLGQADKTPNLLGGQIPHALQESPGACPPRGNLKKPYVQFDFCIWSSIQEREITSPPDTLRARYKHLQKRQFLPESGCFLSHGNEALQLLLRHDIIS